MVQVGGRRPVLKPGMMRNVVENRAAKRGGRRTGSLASGGAVGVRRGQVESAHERAPRDALRIEQVADIFTAHSYRLSVLARTPIAGRIQIAYERSLTNVYQLRSASTGSRRIGSA